MQRTIATLCIMATLALAAGCRNGDGLDDYYPSDDSGHECETADDREYNRLVETYGRDLLDEYVAHFSR